MEHSNAMTVTEGVEHEYDVSRPHQHPRLLWSHPQRFASVGLFEDEVVLLDFSLDSTNLKPERPVILSSEFGSLEILWI